MVVVVSDYHQAPRCLYFKFDSSSKMKTARVTHSAAAAAPAAAEARLHLRLRLHPLRQHRATVPAGASLPPTAQITHSVAAAAAEYRAISTCVLGARILMAAASSAEVPAARCLALQTSDSGAEESD